MTTLPSHLFVIRHGNRLDAADKRWHLTSPTPYDPPLTYGGWLQARATGNQISSYLEQAKLDAESSSSPNKKRKRFKVVIHSSPFLRCLQTSIAIASGLSQTSGETSLRTSDVLYPIPTPPAKKQNDFRSSVLRVDSFLGEWLSHEYFENITPPPKSNMMLGDAKVELLRHEDYSMYTDFAVAVAPQPPRKSSLWSAPPSGASTPSDNESPFATSAMTGALAGSNSPAEKKGYIPPRATYAVSSAGKIPEGFVAHARDQCTSVDYAWDSLREPGFGDGGTLGEEWTAMHKRFRRGLKKALNWYATTERPEKLSEQGSYKGSPLSTEDEEVETVVVIVSHGAGCNALIGAITHQPVLMDVAIASITMAVRKPNLDYDALRQQQAAREPENEPLVPVDHMYDIRLSASTEHLRSRSGTPVSSRSPSVANNAWNAGVGARGRTATLGSSTLTQITFKDPLTEAGSRSTSANAAFVGGVGTSFKREAPPAPRPLPKQSAMASVGGIFGGNNGSTGGPPISSSSPSAGLWSPAPSSLRIMDDGKGEDQDDYGFIDFNRTRFKTQTPREAKAPVLSQVESIPTPTDTTPTVLKTSKGPRLAGQIKLHTNWDNGQVPQEVSASAMQDDDGSAGLWGLPRSPDVEVSRESTASKRRWTVNERTL